MTNNVWWFDQGFNYLSVIYRYIKLHVCFYNDKGILVSHSMETAKNYLRSVILVLFKSIYEFVTGPINHQLGLRASAQALKIALKYLTFQPPDLLLGCLSFSTLSQHLVLFIIELICYRSQFSVLYLLKCWFKLARFTLMCK